VNDAWLGEEAVGCEIDPAFIGRLPPEVDPCGENGEFHSFAFAGPIFKAPLRIKVGEKVYKPLEVITPSGNVAASDAVCPPPSQSRTKGFWFCDLLPAGEPA
jgi:diphthamide synthase (EF-2-diphthine--ammonia ligase)